MILFLLICLFAAIVLPAIPLLVARAANVGIVMTIVAGIVSLAILALIIRRVVIIFGMGEGNTDVPIGIGMFLAFGFVLWTFFAILAAYDRKSAKNRDTHDKNVK